MKKLFVLVLLGLCVCLFNGCGNNSAQPVPPTNGTQDTPTTPNTSTTPDTPTNVGTYLTLDNIPYEIYVTSQPIDGVTDYTWIEPGTGEYSSSGYYYSDMGIAIPFATKWSDGSVTISISPYEGVDYSYDGNSSEFNDTTFVSSIDVDDESSGTEGDVWYIGTAPSDRKKSDYTYDANRTHDDYTSNPGMYVYNGGSSDSGNSANTDQQSTVDQIADDDSDNEDVSGDISENDGRTITP